MQAQSETRNVRWKAARLSEARHIPPNPWRGMYEIHKFMIGDEEAAALPPINRQYTISLVEINLLRFKEERISDAGLAQIDRIFAYFKEQKQGMIIRFLYDWDGEGLKNEPAPITAILRHMDQLSTLLIRYTDSIYTLQGLFVGSWGEMHGSRHLSAQSLITLTQALDEAAERKLMLAVRCPNQWREIFQTYDPPLEERRFDGQRQSRVGLFNDAILASDTDFGTYGQANRAQVSQYGTKLRREEELAFQNRLCAGVLNGGELVRGDGKFTLPEIYRAFKMMHLSYLNVNFDLDALNRLRQEENILHSRSWRGASAYDYLTGHLGYRYQIVKARVQHLDDGVRFRVLVENTGFACCYFPLAVRFFVRTVSGDTVQICTANEDTRLWQPGEKHWVEAPMQSTGLDDGVYHVELELTDPRSDSPVYLASAVRGEAVSETLRIGSVKIGRRG